MEYIESPESFLIVSSSWAFSLRSMATEGVSPLASFLDNRVLWVLSDMVDGAQKAKEKFDRKGRTTNGAVST